MLSPEPAECLNLNISVYHFEMIQFKYTVMNNDMYPPHKKACVGARTGYEDLVGVWSLAHGHLSHSSAYQRKVSNPESPVKG